MADENDSISIGNAIIVMGVSGAGKSTIGAAIACARDAAFLEGDHFHSAENIKKMTDGDALNDYDRIPWIESIIAAVNSNKSSLVVVSCSALTVGLRENLKAGIARRSVFLHLTAPFDVIESRLDARSTHFMKSGLLQSQFDTLETPEDAIKITNDAAIDVVCDRALGALYECGF